jgi:hypothetical protein
LRIARLFAAVLAALLAAQVGLVAHASVSFRSQLTQDFSTICFDAGGASFFLEGDRLRFLIFLDEAYRSNCGAALMTDSRQATIPLGPGEFVFAAMCDPVQVPGSDPPVFNACDGLRSGYAYSGFIPLNETLLRELLAGKGEIFIHLPAQGASGAYWNVPPPVRGRLALMPGSDPVAALAAPPRSPRSLTAVGGSGPVDFPVFGDWPAAGVDVDHDGQVDLGLHGLTLCTMSIPADCSSMYGLACAGGNQLLFSGQAALVVPPGTRIGPTPPGESVWLTSGSIALTRSGSGSCFRPWTDELGRMGEGYLGVKLLRDNREHYGWIRVRLPRGKPLWTLTPYFPDPSGPGGFNPPWSTNLAPTGTPLEIPVSFAEFGPVIEDWAFEPEPGKPILAGAKPVVARLAWEGIPREGYLRVSLASEVGRAYAVQFKPDLSVRTWATIGGLWITASPQSRLDLPLGDGVGFYRVVEAD